MRSTKHIEQSIKNAPIHSDPRINRAVLNELLDQMPQAHATLRLRRFIMQTRISRLTAAAAAVIIVAAFIALYPFTSGTPTFAKVIQPILNARTASLDILIGSQENQAVIHDEVMGSRIRRTVSNVKHSDIIIDLEQQKLLTLNHAEKTAVYIGLGGLDNIENYVELLRNAIIRLQSEPDFQVKEEGLQKIDGQDYAVFVAEIEQETITIWADPETALPVRIEQKTPNMQIACDNVQFDIELDESQFSMVAPDGYAIQDAGAIDFGKSSESDFIETLRIWAEIIKDGQFPDSINLEEVVKAGPKFNQGMKQAGLTTEQQTELAVRWAQGLVFIRYFKGQGQWHYAGAGVELGDAEAPIFWYRPKDSETWRIIYGDLHVENVTEEDLPEPTLTEKQTKIIRSSEQWAQQKFVGTEKDVWHITASGNIVAHSDITLTKMPQNPSVMYVSLPYSSAVLESVILDDKEVPFSMVAKVRYELELPVENLLEGLATIECIWSMPLEALVKVDYGYRIRLQALIPVEGFVLTIVLEPDCGFEYTKDPSQTQIIPFQGDEFSSIVMEFGSCGLLIQKRN